MNRKYSQSRPPRIRAWLAAVCALSLAVLMAVGGAVPAAAQAGHTTHNTPAEVYVGGMPFGVKFYTEGILVVGFCDVDVPHGSGTQAVNPARDAGIRLRDVITAVNGKAPVSAAALTAAVESSGGSPITLTIQRCVSAPGNHTRKTGTGDAATTQLTVTVTPCLSASENRYKTGLWVRDSGAGIGTVTFIMPGSHAFAGLGHGICDGDTGELIPMQRGQVTDVTVSGIQRGEVGAPGAIKGYFTPGKTGSLLGNTECGVYGVFTSHPSAATTKLPVGSRQDVCPGDACILCTLDNGKVGTYKIRIDAIDGKATGSKCFTLTVTDPVLIEKTGGIVQGMSGSPVVQNGKLIGAVTHVMINDPTVGYGIFVDNMIARMPEGLR